MSKIDGLDPLHLAQGSENPAWVRPAMFYPPALLMPQP